MTQSSRMLGGGKTAWRRTLFVAGLCAAWSLACGNGARAQIFVPDDPNAVLASLPERSGPKWREIGRLRESLNESPTDAALAADLTGAYLDVFRLEGDPRMLGYAARSLERWARMPVVPAEIALVRAALAGLQHRFDDAADELQTLLERMPRNGQAWLSLSALDLTRARYVESTRACSQLLLLQDPAVSGTCLAAVQAMTGDADRAYDFLNSQLDRPADLPAELSVWISTLAAETAVALGDDPGASKHFQNAINIDRSSNGAPGVYLVGAYADFLLRRGEHRAALAFAEAAPPSDTALLRIAHARRLLSRNISAEQERLKFRLQLALDGIDMTHAREAAYFALFIEEDPALAGRLAGANWEFQREAADAQLLLAAAVRNCRPEMAEPVNAWMRDNGVEHAVLSAYRQALSSCS